MNSDKIKKKWVRGARTKSENIIEDNSIGAPVINSDDKKAKIEQIMIQYDISFDDANLYYYLSETLKGNPYNTSSRPVLKRARILKKMGLCKISSTIDKFYNITAISI